MFLISLFGLADSRLADYHRTGPFHHTTLANWKRILNKTRHHLFGTLVALAQVETRAHMKVINPKSTAAILILAASVYPAFGQLRGHGSEGGS